jgi:hypothetical protein
MYYNIARRCFYTMIYKRTTQSMYNIDSLIGCTTCQRLTINCIYKCKMYIISTSFNNEKLYT